MDELLYLAVALGLAVWLFHCLVRRWDPLHGMPGPTALPVLGNLPQLLRKEALHTAYRDWAKQYGPVFRVRVGSINMVVVVGYQLIRECLKQNAADFSNRPNWLYIPDKIFHKKGVLWANGEVWKRNRKMALMALRDLGMGKQSLEEKIQQEAKFFCQKISNFNQVPFDPKRMIEISIANIICSIVFGERFEEDNEDFIVLLDLLDFLFTNVGVPIPENFFPWLQYLPFRTPGAQLVENDKKIGEFIKRHIAMHAVTFDPENIRDLLDLYLKMKKDGLENQGTEEENLFRTVVDLFLAGSESTSTSLLWCLLYMATYPEVQNKCFKEIAKGMKDGTKLTYEELANLDYTMATLSEIQRLASVVPLCPPHSTTRPTQIGDFSVPKDTIIMFHLESANKDPRYWCHPEEFLPERWLDQRGHYHKNEAFIPFSTGPRICLGESLAKMELVVYFTTLLYTFTFTFPHNRPRPSLRGHLPGVTLLPERFELVTTKNIV